MNAQMLHHQPFKMSTNENHLSICQRYIEHLTFNSKKLSYKEKQCDIQKYMVHIKEKTNFKMETQTLQFGEVFCLVTVLFLSDTSHKNRGTAEYI